MAMKWSEKYMDGFMPIVQAVEGEYLLGGRMVIDGTVYETFFDALASMNRTVKNNIESGRRVRQGVIVEFRGMVSTSMHVPDSSRHARDKRGGSR